MQSGPSATTIGERIIRSIAGNLTPVASVARLFIEFCCWVSRWNSVGHAPGLDYFGLTGLDLVQPLALHHSHAGTRSQSSRTFNCVSKAMPSPPPSTLIRLCSFDGVAINRLWIIGKRPGGLDLLPRSPVAPNSPWMQRGNRRVAVVTLSHRQSSIVHVQDKSSGAATQAKRATRWLFSEERIPCSHSTAVAVGRYPLVVTCFAG
jgi:hypothetical protein